MSNVNRLTDDELVIRYANNYNLSKDMLNIDMVLKHWHLEKTLTKQLLESPKKNRRQIFYDAYNRLYNDLPWLRDTGSIDIRYSREVYQKKWQPIIGNIEKKKIYEIGSGNGSLITTLASLGAICVATELSEKRPDKRPLLNLEWHSTDGVHLTEYEPQNTYDFVLSDQVIEHLHPEDILEHFKNVRAILNSNGRYIFFTPHYYMGPGDISRVFGCAEAEGMHLKEYKYAEIYKLLKSAGFKQVNILAKGLDTGALSISLQKAFLMLEQTLQLVKSLHLRKRLYNRLKKAFHLSNEIAISAGK